MVSGHLCEQFCPDQDVKAGRQRERKDDTCTRARRWDNGRARVGYKRVRMRFMSTTVLESHLYVRDRRV